MDWPTLPETLKFIQHSISLFGSLIILSGILLAFYHYIRHYFSDHLKSHASYVNSIRLALGRSLLLGLEFIVAADLIGTTTAPDYYTVGIVAIIVLIRTVLSYSLNREIQSISKTAQ